jgi:hypothetical protein
VIQAIKMVFGKSKQIYYLIINFISLIKMQIGLLTQKYKIIIKIIKEEYLKNQHLWIYLKSI